MQFRPPISESDRPFKCLSALRGEVYFMGGKESPGQEGDHRVGVELRGEAGDYAGSGAGDLSKQTMARADYEWVRIRLGVRKADPGETPLSYEELFYATSP